MHGKTMVVVGCLRGDLGTTFFPFRYGGWLEVLASIVHSLTYSSGQSVTSSIVPSYGCSDMVVYDISGAVFFSWSGAAPLNLEAS
jgi:hypothetical protein